MAKPGPPVLVTWRASPIMEPIVATSPLVTIVLAWTEEDYRVVTERRADLGERPAMEKVVAAKTVIWLNEGTPEDLGKAQAYAAQEGRRVFTYPITEEDARARAARDVLALTPDEEAALQAFATTPAHDACTFPHLPDDLRGIAEKLQARGLVNIYNNTVLASAAGRALLKGSSS